jgi:hypothetical protein
MIYFQSETENLLFPPYSDLFDQKSELLCFAKRMCSSNNHPLEYDQFAESEWRIVFSENIKNGLAKRRRDDIAKRFVNPQTTCDTEVSDYYRGIEGDMKPVYLLPLDCWLSMIIYPSPQVKNAAREDKEIQRLIAEVKARGSVSGCPACEKGMWPIELDLDACRNF